MAKVGTEMRSIWVTEQSRREAAVSCHPDRVGTSFACFDFFIQKVFRSVAVPPLPQKAVGFPGLPSYINGYVTFLFVYG